MKAIRKTRRGAGHVELQEVPRPEPPTGWVSLDVTYAGICGTDIHILHDQHAYWPPVTLGHEFLGRIGALGADVEDWRPGDRVVCEPHQGSCGTCHLCRTGNQHLCASKRSPGWGIDGAMAGQVIVPASLLHRVPDRVSDRAAAVCEPAAICLTAITRVGVRPGDAVLVTGPGPIGLITALACKALGAGHVTVVGRPTSRRRLELARSLGLETWDTSEVQVEEAALAVTARQGFDVAFDAAGSAEGLSTAIRALRKRGRLCALGVSGRDTISVPWDEALVRALDIVFSYSSEYSSWDAALALMSTGALDPAPLTEVFSLDDWRTAFAGVEDRQVVKALIDPRIAMTPVHDGLGVPC
jgi:L-iditol 2-dehydrogenase